MKLLAALLLLVVCAAFTERVYAQDCSSIPDCAASIAGDRARQREYERATAVVLQATADARATDAAYNRMVQQTATAMSVAATLTAQPTRTAAPTVTPWPTMRATPTPTSAPTNTVQATPVVQVIVVSATSAPVQNAPQPKRDPAVIVGILLVFGLLIALGGAVYWYSKRQAKSW